MLTRHLEDVYKRQRLEPLGGNEKRIVFKDFAHSPSKLKATVQAVREQFPNRQLVACMELHTYSSLSENFLDQYAGAMDQADAAIVFYDPHAVQLKRLPPIPPERIQRHGQGSAPGRPGTRRKQLQRQLGR